MRILLTGILMLFFLPGSLWGQSLALPRDRAITLVFSSSVQGEFEPCG
jgi:hypothetical protein